MSKTPDSGPTAGASGGPDPIFAAIDGHRAALRGWLAAYERLVLQDMIPPEAPPEAPEWIEANAAFLAASEDVAQALVAVLSTQPATIAGVAGVLEYAGRDEWELATSLAHVPEKACPGLDPGWIPVFRKGHAPIKESRAHPGSTQPGCALDPPDAGLRHPLGFDGTVLGNAFKHPVAKNSAAGLRKAAADFLPMIAATLPRRAAGGTDPSFAAIERHRTALRGWLAAGEQVWRETIPPELETAVEELHDALEAVLSTAPATMAGVADLLDYAGRDAWELLLSVRSADVDLLDSNDFDGMDSNDFDGTVLETAFESWVEKLETAAETFLPMVAATLRSLAAAPSHSG